MKEDSIVNQDMIDEKEVAIKELEVIIDNKGALGPACEDCQPCKKDKAVCDCFCTACKEVHRYLIWQIVTRK